MSDRPHRVLVVRGDLPTPWELPSFRLLPERFEVRYLRSGTNRFEVGDDVPDAQPVRALRDRLPAGRTGDVAARLLRDRYLGAEDAFAWADVVHAAELSYWFASEAARLKPAGARLVQTIWETIPFLETYRTRQARRHRRAVLAATDLFLPVSQRSADALRLEGVSQDRIVVAEPGVDLARFAVTPARVPAAHVVLSPGRLVWEKGHQDALRAVAALVDGLVPAPPAAVAGLRLRVIGAGPEERRLAAYAAELGIAGRVEIGPLPFTDMPQAFAQASAMVLASLPLAGGGLHPLDVPRVFWEEQFGYVLAEAMASGLAIVTTTSGAIPEVVQGTADLVAPGDWMGIARALAAGPLSRPPGERVTRAPELLERLSHPAAAARLAAAYDRVLAAPAIDSSAASVSDAVRSHE